MNQAPVEGRADNLPVFQNSSHEDIDLMAAELFFFLNFSTSCI